MRCDLEFVGSVPGVQSKNTSFDKLQGEAHVNVYWFLISWSGRSAENPARDVHAHV
jgi:hypothetical protein